MSLPLGNISGIFNARVHRNLTLHRSKRLNIDNLENSSKFNCVFTATVLLQETDWMKTYQSVKNDTFEYNSSFPLFPRHEVSGKESDPSAGRIDHPATNKTEICDIGEVQGRKFRMNGAGMKAKKLFCHLEKGLWMLDNHTHKNLEFFFLNLESAYSELSRRTAIPMRILRCSICTNFRPHNGDDFLGNVAFRTQHFQRTWTDGIDVYGQLFSRSRSNIATLFFLFCALGIKYAQSCGKSKRKLLILGPYKH